MASHQVHYLVGTHGEQAEWKLQHPGTTCVFISTSATGTLNGRYINPWDEVHHFESYFQMAESARHVLADEITRARAKGRTLSP